MNDFSVVMATIDSSRWIQKIHKYYQELGLDPFYVVNAATVDDTEAKLSEVGARFKTIAYPKPLAESVVYRFGEFVDTQWILRFDDDEVPAPELISWVRACGLSVETAGFARWYVRLVSTGLESITSRAWGDDRQWRLWRKDAVQYIDASHSPGFIVGARTFAPADAIIWHLNCIIRTPDERMEKKKVADANKWGDGGAGDYRPFEEMQWEVTEPVQNQPLLDFVNKVKWMP